MILTWGTSRSKERKNPQWTARISSSLFFISPIVDGHFLTADTTMTATMLVAFEGEHESLPGIITSFVSVFLAFLVNIDEVHEAGDVLLLVVVVFIVVVVVFVVVFDALIFIVTVVIVTVVIVTVVIVIVITLVISVGLILILAEGIKSLPSSKTALFGYFRSPFG